MINYGQILENKVDDAVIDESFDLGEKMLGKYARFDSIMGMKADEFEDMKQLYKLAIRFKEQAIKSIRQQNQQSEMIYDLTEIVKELRKEVAFLREDVDSLKSKAKKND